MRFYSLRECKVARIKNATIKKKILLRVSSEWNKYKRQLTEYKIAN